MSYIYTAVEDDVSESVVRRLASEQGLTVSVCLKKSGNGMLKKRLPELIKLAPAIPVFLLTDLDNVECAPTLKSDWLGARQCPKGLMFRVAVREVEAWLLADREGFARFSSVSAKKLPLNPEELADPKQTLLNLVYKHARSSVKRDLVTDYGSGPQPAYSYNLSLGRYVSQIWDVKSASSASNSLERALRRLGEVHL